MGRGGRGWIPPNFFLANCSAHRPPTEKVLYFLERPCPDYFKRYKTISVGVLGAEQFEFKIVNTQLKL